LGGSHFFVIFFKRLFYSVPWYAFTLPFSFFFFFMVVPWQHCGHIGKCQQLHQADISLPDREQAPVSVYIEGDVVEDRE
jgi:hypothetical protein